MDTTFWILTTLRITALLFGLVFLYYTGRAYLKHRDRSIALLFSAISLLLAGSIVEGAVVGILGWDLETGHILESAFILAAFAVLTFSVTYRRRAVRSS